VSELKRPVEDPSVPPPAGMGRVRLRAIGQTYIRCGFQMFVDDARDYDATSDELAVLRSDEAHHAKTFRRFELEVIAEPGGAP
jgi:hypothetical protein